MELYHHGILGQRWGIRRFQDKTGRLTKAGKERYENKDSTNNVDNADEKNPSSINKKKKAAIIVGSVAAASALAAIGGYALYKSGKLDPKIEELKTIGELALISKGINPNRKGSFHLKASDGKDIDQVNCVSCTVANELSRRGIPTMAGLTDTRSYDCTYLLKSSFKFEKLDFSDVLRYGFTSKELKDRILSMGGNGSRGALILAGLKGGHALSYEVINNKPYIIDSQIGKVYPFKLAMLKYKVLYGMSNAAYPVRLDNRSINDQKFLNKFTNGQIL